MKALELAKFLLDFPDDEVYISSKEGKLSLVVSTVIENDKPIILLEDTNGKDCRVFVKDIEDRVLNGEIIIPEAVSSFYERDISLNAVHDYCNDNNIAFEYFKLLLNKRKYNLINPRRKSIVTSWQYLGSDLERIAGWLYEAYKLGYIDSIAETMYLMANFNISTEQLDHISDASFKNKYSEFLYINKI